MDILERRNKVFDRLNQVCQTCDKAGCCSKCFSNMFQEDILQFKNNPETLKVVLMLAENKLDKYEKSK